MMFEDYTYEITPDQSIGIVRYLGCEEELLLPAQIDGLPVKTIRQHAFTMTDVVDIRIPEGVEVIATEAFAMCESLQHVSLPASLQTIGAGAFKSCEALREIECAQANPRYLVRDGLLYDRLEAALVLCPPGLDLESVAVPYGIRTISSAAFYLNRKLRHVSLPLSLERIESEAFLFTSALPMLELPPYLKEIEENCFLMGIEKRFMLYAFPNSVGFRYAQEHHIPVHPLYAIVTD